MTQLFFFDDRVPFKVSIDFPFLQTFGSVLLSVDLFAF